MLNKSFPIYYYKLEEIQEPRKYQILSKMMARTTLWGRELSKTDSKLEEDTNQRKSKRQLKEYNAMNEKWMH